MVKKPSSVEEQVEDWGKAQLSTADIHYYTKTETINEVIAAALRAAPSKSGGSGNNYPDIKVLLVSPKNPDRHLPVMMEAKGTKGKLVKLANDGTIANTKQGGEPNYTNINGYAVNGAVHYAQAIVNNSNDVYPECLAIGLNGYKEDGELLYEVEVWYIDKENFALPKKIGNYSDLSFLFPAHQEVLFEELDRCVLTEEEIETQRFLLETEFDGLLADYNQYLHDDLHITANNRIALTVGLILAGIGAPGVSPLQFTDFKGETGSTVHDGMIVYNKIQSFLEAKHLPQSELRTVMNYLEAPFTTATYYTPSSTGSFSKIALAHQATQKILPLLLSSHRIDYMGRLFNKLLAWAALADDADNDVVLTPRYITNFMARLGRVDMNSYVWDWAAGTGGFLVSAMNMMMADAEERISSPDELEKKKQSIRVRQLLGIEIRGDIYLLNLLNMLLLDGSFANVIQADSLNKQQFDGDYPYSAVPEPFPANVFLLNPPCIISSIFCLNLQKAA